jgi:aminopeptidase-like protein
MMNLLAYADGQHDLIAIADRIGENIRECAAIANQLVEAGVIRLA